MRPIATRSSRGHRRGAWARYGRVPRERDVTKLAYDATLNTVLDCTLFHSLPFEARDEYLRVIHRSAALGASLYILVLTSDALPADSPFPVPNLVTNDELQQAVSAH
jgi:hypothetical protein